MDPPTEGTNLPSSTETFSKNAILEGSPKDVLSEQPKDLIDQPPKGLDVFPGHVPENEFQDAKIEIPDKLGEQVQDILSKNKEVNIHTFPETIIEQPNVSETQTLNGVNNFNDHLDEAPITQEPITESNPKKTNNKSKKPISKFREIPPEYPDGPRRYMRRKEPYEIRPARRIPKYLPDVDGNVWKVWAYPDAIELSTDSEEELVELPVGFRIVDNKVVRERPLVDFDEITHPAYNAVVKTIMGIMIVLNLYKVGDALVKKVLKILGKIEEDEVPGASDESSEDPDSDY